LLNLRSDLAPVLERRFPVLTTSGKAPAVWNAIFASRTKADNMEYVFANIDAD
jgi:hypothetical protein